MKHSHLCIAFFAGAALTLSCSKETPQQIPAPLPEEDLVEVTLIADNPEAASATKTEMNGSTPYWSAGDVIGVSNGTKTNYKFTTGISAASRTASFTGTTTVDGPLYAYYPYTANGVDESISGTGAAGAKVDLPAEQEPTATSFDGAADLMVAKSFTVSSSKTVSNLEFTRLGAIVKLVFKDRNGVMQSVQHPSTVSMTAQSDLAGRLVIDMQNQELSALYYNASKTVTARYTTDTQYTIDGTGAAYLIVYPQTLPAGSTLRIEAATEDYLLAKTISVPNGGIELLPGKVTTLNIGLDPGHITEKADADSYSLYTGAITEGDYVITSGTTAMKAAVKDSRLDYAGVTITDDAILNPNASLVWHVAGSGNYWTLYNAEAQRYAASTGGASKAQLLTSGTDNKSLWTVTGTGSYEFVNKQNTASSVNANLRYNSGYGFACYSTGTGTALTLYKRTSGKPTATATVTTAAVTDIQPTTATFGGAFSGATGTISDHGFRYKKSSESTWTTIGLNSTTGTSGNFTYPASGLSEGTTYEVKAYVTEWDANANAYVDKEGPVVTFTTTTSAPAIPLYLDDYGIPDVSSLLSGTGTSGSYSTTGDNWYRYNTTSSNRQIAVHTYTHPTSEEETVNYVVLYDGSRYAPVWTAHTMNSTYWPNNNATREDKWISDPAISLTQISGLDDNNTYSRGHLVASSYRKSSQDQNAQTFYYTNKAPQYQNGFNNGVWSSLEARVVNQTPSGTGTMLYVVTGVLYEGTLTYMPRGSLSVPLPSHFYKCILKCTLNGSGVPTTAQGIAFVYTNESHSGKNYYDSAYVTTIDAIEERTGFDFFAKVPEALQNSAEANRNHTWFTGQNSSNISTITDTDWGSL